MMTQFEGPKPINENKCKSKRSSTQLTQYQFEPIRVYLLYTEFLMYLLLHNIFKHGMLILNLL